MLHLLARKEEGKKARVRGRKRNERKGVEQGDILGKEAEVFKNKGRCFTRYLEGKDFSKFCMKAYSTSVS